MMMTLRELMCTYLEWIQRKPMTEDHPELGKGNGAGKAISNRAWEEGLLTHDEKENALSDHEKKYPMDTTAG